MTDLYRITLSYATFGVIVEEDVVTEAAPIGHWMKGKTIATVRSWVERKGGAVEKL